MFDLIQAIAALLMMASVVIIGKYEWEDLGALISAGIVILLGICVVLVVGMPLYRIMAL